MNPLFDFPFVVEINTGAIDTAFRQFAKDADWILSIIRDVLNFWLSSIGSILEFIPWWVYIAFVFVLMFMKSKKILTATLYSLLLFLIGLVGLWDLMLTTLAIILAAVFLSLIIGFPIGVLMALSDRLSNIIRPILDTMQTMPVFVYLIPAIILFGLGRVPGTLATTIYAIVPIIRLTDLGIRQVDKELVEAVHSFGATQMQALIKVKIPQAFPTIMAGVNQTIMMAMSMVVTTSMIGVTGLGMEVLISVNRIEVGRGLVSGTAVVIIAILLDRLSQGWSKIEAIQEDNA